MVDSNQMRKRGDLDVMELSVLPNGGPVRGEVELVADGEHLDRVVREGILAARFSVDIATADFKAMLVPADPTLRPRSLAQRRRGGRGRGEAPSIVSHLAGLAARGVEVRVLHAGVPSAAALEELKALMDKGNARGRIMFRRCPRLHTKAVVVDAAWVYLGSANLTGAGLGAKGPTRRNFELGVISRTGELVDAVLGRFNALWEGEPCAGCGRRDVCPVPLEEPAL